MNTKKELISHVMSGTTYNHLDEHSYLLEGGDMCLHDIAHEIADNSADVIYYGRALKLINDTSCNGVSEAENMIINCGFEFKSFNDTCCQLAFWITYNSVVSELHDDIRTALDVLERVDVYNFYEDENCRDEEEKREEMQWLIDELTSNLESL